MKRGGGGRKHGRNFRFSGVRQSNTSYKSRRLLGVPKGGDGGAWRRMTGRVL